MTYDLVAEHFGPGHNGPLLVTGTIVGSTDPLGLMADLKAEIAKLPGVASVPLATPNQDATVGIIQVIPQGGPDSQQTADLVRELRSMEPHFKAAYGVDLAVNEGEVYGFLGPNGAGKTTLVRMLVTLLRPTRGTARVAGKDIVKNPGAVRSAIGVTLQEAALDGFVDLVRLQDAAARAGQGQNRAIGYPDGSLVGVEQLSVAHHLPTMPYRRPEPERKLVCKRFLTCRSARFNSGREFSNRLLDSEALRCSPAPSGWEPAAAVQLRPGL